MSVVEQNISVAMVRPTLDGVPDFSLPEPYHWRWYEPGDEGHWLAIHAAADRFNQLTEMEFWQDFGRETTVLSQRQLYLLDGNGEPVGTASAWFDDAINGRVHWVAIHPAHQGKGLAKPLLSTVCQRLHQLGHQTAHLGTSTGRIAALNLYLSFGFVPNIRSEEDRTAWQGLQPYLKYRV
jgi:GNAT superfamily N-acetyltransferase